MNVQQLMEAVTELVAIDALPCRLTLDEWKTLAPYLSVRPLHASEPFIRDGDADREVFILAEGEVDVFVQGRRTAKLGAGSVVGEMSFFCGEPRSATVVPVRSGVAWCLAWDGFQSLAGQYPAIALELMRGLAQVLAVRMRQTLLGRPHHLHA